MNDENKSLENESFVLIRFEGAGQSAFTLQVNNASPAQILGATGILETYAKNAYLQEQTERMQRAMQNKLTVPDGKILVGKQ